jgi:hypothetical protein
VGKRTEQKFRGGGILCNVDKNVLLYRIICIRIEICTYIINNIRYFYIVVCVCVCVCVCVFVCIGSSDGECG